MSRTPIFYLEKMNLKTGKYELCHPKVPGYSVEPGSKGNYVFADLFPYNGCHDLFSIVEESGSEFPKMAGIHYGMPLDVCDYIRKDYENPLKEDEDGYYGTDWKPTARWFTVADLYIYLMEHPKIEVYDEDADDGSKIFVTNPLKGLKTRVDAFMEIMNDWNKEDDRSITRVVYWIE